MASRDNCCLPLLPSHPPCLFTLVRKPYHKPLISISLPSYLHRAFRVKSEPSPDVLRHPDLWNVDSSGAPESSGSSVVTGADTKFPPPPLAVELIERIADFLFEIKPPVPDSTGDVPLCCAKPPWEDVRGFMAASLELHRMGFTRWIRVVTIKKSEDWSIISQNLHLVRYCYPNH